MRHVDDDDVIITDLMHTHTPRDEPYTKPSQNSSRNDDDGEKLFGQTPMSRRKFL